MRRLGSFGIMAMLGAASACTEHSPVVDTDPPTTRRNDVDVDVDVDVPATEQRDDPDEGRGCATLPNPEAAIELASAEARRIGYELDSQFIGHGRTRRLSAMLPKSWPPRDCEVVFYVTSRGITPNGLPVGPATEAWIAVDLASGSVRNGRPPGWLTEAPKLDARSQDAMFAVVGRGRAPRRDDFAPYLAALQLSRHGELLPLWHAEFLRYLAPTLLLESQLANKPYWSPPAPPWF